MDMVDYEYKVNWRKERTRRFEFYISKDDTKLLDWFNNVPNKQAMILELLEKERKKQKRKEKNGEKV